MDSKYDIYIKSEVDALKRDYRELQARHQDTLRENRELRKRLEERRRLRDEDFGWMNG